MRVRVRVCVWLCVCVFSFFFSVQPTPCICVLFCCCVSRGNDCFKNKQFHDAIDYYTKAIELDPDVRRCRAACVLSSCFGSFLVVPTRHVFSLVHQVPAYYTNRAFAYIKTEGTIPHACATAKHRAFTSSILGPHLEHHAHQLTSPFLVMRTFLFVPLLACLFVRLSVCVCVCVPVFVVCVSVWQTGFGAALDDADSALRRNPRFIKVSLSFMASQR